MKDDKRQLWVYWKEGVFRFCDEDLWDRLYALVVDAGWEPLSAEETMWMESPLIQYKPGSFFTAEDASSFAGALRDFQKKPSSHVPPDLQSLAERVEELFGTGPTFIRPEPPHKTADADSFEVVHVYFCPQCGFMHHGNWYFSIVESSPDEAGTSVESILKYKYCPLCGSKDVRTVAFVLPQLDPDELPSLCDPVEHHEPSMREE